MNPVLPTSKKFHCVTSGEKRAEPCMGCTNSNACMTSAMQIKEPYVDTNQKAVVKISVEGDVLKCAKGLDTAECGYKAGAKVCGACGAMATEVKGEGEYCSCDEPDVKDGMCSKCGMAVMDEKMLEDHTYTPMKKRVQGKSADDVDDDDAPSFAIDDDVDAKAYGTGQEREMDPNDMGFAMDLKKKRKKRRLDSMGMKSDDIDVSDLFLCSLGREVKSASAAGPCADCRGGCTSSDGAPDLLEIEGIAEDSLMGKVHNSGYSDQFDMFVVQVERKDGQYVEAYFTGEGELDGWFRIPEEEVLGRTDVVDIETAMKSALGAIEGKALSYGVSEFEGYEAFTIEIEGKDGKSYDVFVAPDGEVLGYDQYEWDYDDIIDGTKAYSQDDRDEMAAKGQALPDGSYPIKDEDDLENAVMAYGRAKDKKSARAHIEKRAEELGRMDMLPDTWDDGDDETEEKSATVVLSDIEAALLEMQMIALEQDLNDPA
jgi:hypothetical protein